MKRVFSLMLAVIMALMVFAAIGNTAFAAACNYVCLGDSVSNGYGLDGYLKPDGTNVRGYKQVVECAYHNIVAKELGAKLDQLGFSGYRAEDMLYMLDPSYESDTYTQGYFIDTGRFDNCGGLEKCAKSMKKQSKKLTI